VASNCSTEGRGFGLSRWRSMPNAVMGEYCCEQHGEDGEPGPDAPVDASHFSSGRRKSSLLMGRRTCSWKTPASVSVTSPGVSLNLPKGEVENEENEENEIFIVKLRKRSSSFLESSRARTSSMINGFRSSPDIGVSLNSVDVRPLAVIHYTPAKRPIIPPQAFDAKRMTLVLDLDETLIHSTTSKRYAKSCDFSLRIGGSLTKRGVKFYVFKRPNVEEFLKRVCEWYEVVIFSGSSADYVNAIMKRLDPDRRCTHILSREHCVHAGRGCFVRDLSLLGRDPRHTIIVSNSVVAFGFQPENAIKIPSFLASPADFQLPKLLNILERARFLKDVRNASIRK